MTEYYSYMRIIYQTSASPGRDTYGTFIRQYHVIY
jgi:hypothetical protein